MGTGLGLDAAIFASFLGMALCFDRLEAWIEVHRAKHHEPTAAKHRLTKYLVVATGHPAVWNAAHEFAVHVVVYSGKVFPGH